MMVSKNLLIGSFRIMKQQGSKISKSKDQKCKRRREQGVLEREGGRGRNAGQETIEARR